jgi:hypothetical protein
MTSWPLCCVLLDDNGRAATYMTWAPSAYQNVVLAVYPFSGDAAAKHYLSVVDALHRNTPSKSFYEHCIAVAKCGGLSYASKPDEKLVQYIEETLVHSHTTQ